MHKRSHYFGLMLALGLMTSAPAQAGGNDITLDPTLIQAEFDALVDELGMAIAYNPYSPAEPLGTIGFEVGLAITTVDIDPAIWDKAVSDADAPDSLPVPRIMIRKGLPFGIDIGAAYTKIPGSNVNVLGGEIRKALMEGSTVAPAVAVIGHASQLNGVDDIDLTTYGIDLGISKGFAMLTPYAGIGQVWIKGEEKAGLGLAKQDTSEVRSYLGVKVGFLPVLNLVAQADFAVVNSYTLRLNLGF